MKQLIGISAWFAEAFGTGFGIESLSHVTDLAARRDAEHIMVPAIANTRCWQPALGYAFAIPTNSLGKFYAGDQLSNSNLIVCTKFRP